MTPEQIAQVCHETNRAYCQCIGDDSQVPWSEAPDWQKDSAVRGVLALISDPSTSPEQLHTLWYADKVRDGWRYGPVKDAEAKTHPCLVLYKQLPEQQRVKDYLFQAVVRILARLPGGYVHI